MSPVRFSTVSLTQYLQPLKRRIPKQNASPIEVTKPKQFNNGNIEIIHPETSASQAANRVSVDEVLINGRRYRVPERVIVLDFWSKVGINEGLGVRYATFSYVPPSHTLTKHSQGIGCRFWDVLTIDLTQLSGRSR